MNALSAEGDPTFSDTKRLTPHPIPSADRENSQIMRLALQAKFLDCSSMSHQAQADYFFQEYGIRVSKVIIGREIKRTKWSKKWCQHSLRSNDRASRVTHTGDPISSHHVWYFCSGHMFSASTRNIQHAWCVAKRRENDISTTDERRKYIY